MKQTVILKNKLFLYLTEFFAGMSVMAGGGEPADCWHRISVRRRSSGRSLSEPS